MIKGNGKKILSMLMTLAMLFSLIPVVTITARAAVTWSVKSTSPSTGETFADFAYGDNCILAVTYENGQVYKSTDDGLNWSLLTTLGVNIGYIAFGNGMFVATNNSTNIVYYSTNDGTSWTPVTLNGNSGRGMTGITYGSGGFAVTSCDSSYSDIFTSSNGSSWTLQKTGLVDGGSGLCLANVGYGNGVYAAVGSDGRVYTASSSDMTTWTLASSSSTSYLMSVAYGNGVFVAVGQDGKTVISSDNGATWADSVYSAGTALNDITFAGGVFYAAGNGGLIISSLDGSTWTANTSNTVQNLWGIASGASHFVAGGEVGTIVTGAPDMSPSITSISPTAGPTAGGTTVTITGTNFTGATAVSFGGTAAASYTVNSATQITATAPAGSAGTVDIYITTANGTNTAAAADHYTYVAAPTVTSISPTAGPISGGTSVTITGTNFTGATAVSFAGSSATSFTVNSATSITATAPAGTGTVDITVTTAGGTSATSAADQFTYIPAPTVSSISPTSGPAAGGTTVTITGSNFTGATAVSFGGTAAVSFTVNSATSITATAPAGTGTVDITVTTPGGTSATSAADQFTYIPAPTVTSISPTAGLAAGGTTVTITGTNFTGATAVSFGGTAATGFTVNSATSITATAPAGTGTVDITVTTPGGTSATSVADQFTYVAAPTVTSISPTAGPISGGTTVTITGTNFTGATAVSFGGTAAASYTVNSATQITATAPAGSSGTVDVTVTAAGGTSVTSAADQFTYDAAPVVTTSGGSTSFIETAGGTSTPVAVDSGITVSDVDNTTLTSGTVSITGNLHTSEDVLAFTNDGSTMGNIAGSYNTGTGVLTLTSSGATATLAQWQSALSAVTYTNTSHNPSTATRTISFTINDGSLNSNTATKTVTIIAANDAPVVTTSGGPTDYTVVQSPVVIDSGLTVSDVDNATLASGTVAITSNLQSGEDVLSFVNNGSTMGNIVASYNAATGVLTLTSSGATATLAQWQNALRAITYTNSSVSTQTATRVVSFIVNDGALNSTVSTKTVNIAIVNDPPSVSSIDRLSPASSSTNAANVTYRVTFSKAVTGVDVTDFTLTETGTASGTITSVSSASGTVIDVTVNGITGEGTLRLDLKSSGTGIQDSTLQNITGGFTSGQIYTVDRVAPTVSSVSVPANGSYKAGDTLTFTVNFSEAVTVTGTPALSITLDTGGTVSADYVSGSASSALVFAYTILNGNADSTGITVGTLSGTIKDAAGNDAALTLNSVGSTTNVLVDTTAPTAGNSGTIAVSDLTSSSAKLTWTAATDTGTLPANLQYKVVYSTSDITSVAAADALPGTWTSNITTATVTGLIASTDYHFNVLVKDEAGNIVLYSSATGKTSAAASATTGGSSTDVEVNGQPYSAGTTTTTTNTDGQTQTTVTVDTDKLNDILNQKGQGATVTVPVTGGSDVAAAALTGDMMNTLQDNGATLVIQTDSASYSLPASNLDMGAITQQFGGNVDPSKVTVNVSIAEPTSTVATVVVDAANEGGFTIQVPAVDFTVTCTYNGQTASVTAFNSYVQRTVAIPDGVDPTKITTGVVVDPDGTVHHVPTKVTVIDGKYYAVINSLTNSTYTVIWHPVEFSDVTNSWAKDAINDMGSRMVVTGVDGKNYQPDRDITRAEFAAIVVRALGLEQGMGTSKFSDIKSTDWYYGYVETAVGYNLIKGYDDGTFRPNDKITRQEAMAIIARAMDITKLSPTLTDSQVAALLAPFSDSNSASSWAKMNIAACLRTGVINGRTSTTLGPTANISRAEVAVIVQRLLQKSNLI